ncbi:MAG: hypothetical protein J6Z45_02280, partial [Oscillospiraceae bacterium]|nr:hypothetical protein [Oscillospiraceae bacterium]
MKSKFFLRLTALTVTACMMFSNQPWTIAAAEAEQAKALSKTYMSEVKVFYAENADQAKQFCANEGYLFCPTNLNEGGKNQWSSSDHAVKTLEVYLGYKTTKDPSDAITDISLLDMKNSYYQTMNYGEYLDKYIGEFHNQAEKYLSLVKEYQNKYAAGSPKAIAACDSLNMFYVKEEIFFRGPSDPQYNGNLLGNYLLKNDDITLFEKLLQRGNAQVVNKIISILCQAAADYDSPESIRAAEEAAARAAENPDAGITVPKLNKTWIDRAKVSEIETEYERASSSARSEYN